PTRAGTPPTTAHAERRPPPGPAGPRTRPRRGRTCPWGRCGQPGRRAPGRRQTPRGTTERARARGARARAAARRAVRRTVRLAGPRARPDPAPRPARRGGAVAERGATRPSVVRARQELSRGRPSPSRRARARRRRARTPAGGTTRAGGRGAPRAARPPP